MIAIQEMFRNLAVLCCLVGSALAVSPVEVRGQHFFVPASNQRFTIIGITYQPGGQSGYNPGSSSDALTDGRICLRDAAIMQNLGINTIRVYNIHPFLNHDECASIFNAVGIHMLIDVNSPLRGESLDRSNPSGSYTQAYIARTFAVVEAFKDYPNTLGFVAANEVINDLGTARDNPPYIRAIQRDLKHYIGKHASRRIPVGYSAAEVHDVLIDSWAYFQCAINGNIGDTSRSDFFGLNSYSWCGADSTFSTSGYDKLATAFGQSSVPVFFSEYGCNRIKPRVFDEVRAIYGHDMTMFSGGLVYEYSQEASDYGLVEISADGSVRLRVDFNNLQSKLNEVHLGLIKASNATANAITPPTCASTLIATSGFSNNFNIPVAPPGVEDMINNGLPNPNRGRIIAIQNTQVPLRVFDVVGNEIKGLAIRPLPDNESNTPNPNQILGSGSNYTNSTNQAQSGSAGKAELSGGVWGLILTTVLFYFAF